MLGIQKFVSDVGTGVVTNIVAERSNHPLTKALARGVQVFSIFEPATAATNAILTSSYLQFGSVLAREAFVHSASNTISKGVLELEAVTYTLRQEGNTLICESGFPSDEVDGHVPMVYRPLLRDIKPESPTDESETLHNALLAARRAGIARATAVIAAKNARNAVLMDSAAMRLVRRLSGEVRPKKLRDMYHVRHALEFGLTSMQMGKYEGTWREESIEGYGVWSGEEGHSFSGQWTYSMPRGYGVRTLPKGKQYWGILSGAKVCIGVSICRQSNYWHVGEHAFGKPDGFGRRVYKHGYGSNRSGIWYGDRLSTHIPTPVERYDDLIRRRPYMAAGINRPDRFGDTLFDLEVQRIGLIE